MSNEIEYTQISVEELKQLQKDSFVLACLERAGVDNWDGYAFALEDYQEEYND